MIEGTAPRGAAFEILRRVRAGQLFATASQSALANLSAPDRRLAHEIAAGVLRRRTALDQRLRPLVSGSWRQTSPDLKDLLRIGAFQLIELDRVPAYGAVQATVEVAKREGGRRGAGLVNAVLRRVAEGPGETGADRGPTSEIQRLANDFSHPAWLVSRWCDVFGRERTVSLLEFNNRRPLVVVQPARWTDRELREAFTAQGVEFIDAPLGMGLAVHGGRITELPGFGEGAFVVQDAAQAYVMEKMLVAEHGTVWDACAAPGGKAALISRRFRVLASDAHRHRVTRLRATVSRVAPRVPVFIADARQPPVNFSRVSLVLIDTPCSGTDTFARHPDARWRMTPDRLRDVVRLQADILDGVASATTPGTELIYLTCSLEPEENSGQIDRFLARHPMFARAREDVFVFPPDTGTDGAFGARLTRA